ncbi:glucans biosynthesis glucosyltransferase H [Waddlia chondrophila 2032/99]|uniref:Glucans biosynthesis glucosyltransferase H n=1 Tax=Waddlia chondrophila 2032/99 TaxID=765953 RepID=F8LAS3_9BACT|nr:glucans biosynthesis glucosyltransferase H [Waddlia chondrophila 2032/99]
MHHQFPSKLPGGSAMPSEKKGEFPKQSLNQASENPPRKPIDDQAMTPSLFRRFLVPGFALALSIYAVYEMVNIFLLGSLTTLEIVVIFLFAINFNWIALGFSQSLAGFFSQFRSPSPDYGEVELNTRTAVLMPIYNESPARVFALIEEIALEIESTPYGSAFDWFILSDSNQSSIVLAEEQAFCKLRSATADKARIYYRRRVRNRAQKSGNIEDFCLRWGRNYDHFIVLDADSIVEAKTLIKLAQRMQNDPDAGLIQTLPVLINAKTPFAKIQQLASKLYGPLLGKGLAWWTQKEGNYWGHNAIIRTEAFMKSAGLPTLNGPPPFGGNILSHDFVEAALIRRAGWSVVIAPDLSGSYEESPPSIYDMAIRDRRWCQGNLQHSKVIHAHGLHWVSRFHLAAGILSYLSPLMWLMLIISGLLLSLQAHYLLPEYFPEKFSLFPTWPIMDYKRAISLFVFTMGVLLGPKIFGLASVIFKNNDCKLWGGRQRLILSFLIEVVLSALIAPIMMLQQSTNVISITLFGKHSSWKPQRRNDGSLPYKELFRFHRWHIAAGLLLAFAASLYSWVLVAWVSPAVLGLLISIPLSKLTASNRIGEWFKNKHLLLTPEETTPPKIALALEEKLQEYDTHLKNIWDLEMLLKHPKLLALHIEMVDQPKQEAQSKASRDPLDAIAIVKVLHAKDQKELLQTLTDSESCYILGQPELLRKIAELPPSKNVLCLNAVHRM